MAKFNFTVNDDALLDKLADATGRQTKADVVRDALAVYKVLLQRAQNGEKIFIGRDKAEAAPLIVTTLEQASSSDKKIS